MLFGIQAFPARVHNLLRLPGTATAPESATVYDDGHLRADPAAPEVSVAGECAHLTRKEFTILQTMIARPGQVFMQTQLFREIWGPTHVRDTHCLRNFVGRLRQKLRDGSGEPR